MTNEIKGYSLFNDIEDTELRIRNRAVVMANIFEDNLDGDAKVDAVTIKGDGAVLLLQYVKNIPEEEMVPTWDKFKSIMTEERGFKYAG